MRRSLLLIVSVFILSVSALRAQTDAALSQYWFLPSYYNAAAIGLTDSINIRGAGRLQWVGIDGAPRTFVAAADMPVKLTRRHRLGVGVLFNQESIGLYNTLSVSAQIAYNIRLFRGILTVGLQPGFVDQSFKGSEVVLPDGDGFHDSNDDGIPTRDIRGNSFDLGVGVYYRRGAWWGGFSITHLNSPVISLDAESGADTQQQNFEFRIPRALYFMAGGNIRVRNTLLEVIPSVIVRNAASFTSADFTARLRYNRTFSAGIGYRWRDAVAFMLMAEIKGVILGYAYDCPISGAMRSSGGSHEIVAGYRLKLDLSEPNPYRHKSIRIL